MKTSAIHLVIACTALLLATSCTKTSDDLCIPGIDLEVFDSELHAGMPSELKGYAYLIMKNGQVQYVRADGHARSPQDGLQPWDEHQQMHVASISKTISTVATLRLLQMKGLSVDEPIYKYLPGDWAIGDNVQHITFRELMRHQAAFLDVVNEEPTLSTTYDGLKAMVAHGASIWKKRKYSNVHHALLRIILPVLWDYPNSSTSIYDEDYTARRYEEIVRQLVFDPIGISAALKDDDPEGGVLAYSSATDPEGTFETFDYTKTAGGYGWVLSPHDLAKFWAYLWHSDELLDETQRSLMRQHHLGLWNSGETVTGNYYCKLGGWYRTENGQEHWLRSAAVEFSDGTAVVLFANSPSAKGLRDLIVEAYEKAYGCF